MVMNDPAFHPSIRLEWLIRHSWLIHWHDGSNDDQSVIHDGLVMSHDGLVMNRWRDHHRGRISRRRR
jgi:hypothetical protein